MSKATNAAAAALSVAKPPKMPQNSGVLRRGAATSTGVRFSAMRRWMAPHIAGGTPGSA